MSTSEFSLDSVFTSPADDLLVPMPFADEETYWAVVRACLLARQRRREVEDAVLRAVTVGDFGEPAGHQRLVAAQALIGRLVDAESATRRALLERTGLTQPELAAPRLIRLRYRMALTDVQVDLLQYLVLEYTEPAFSAGRLRRRAIGEIAPFLGLDAAAIFDIADSSNALRREGILELDLGIGEGAMLDWQVGMHVQVVKALRGHSLALSDRYATPPGALRELLDEEFGPVGLSGGADAEDARAEEPQNPESDAPGVARHVQGALDLGTLLSGEKARLSPAMGEEAPDVGPIEVYRNDLEYLNDQVAWICARAEWKRLLIDEPRFGLNERPEVTARQKRASESVLRRNAADRLAATRAAGRWEPRLERLVRARGYDDFEKNVLLLLTGLAGSVDLRRRLHETSASIAIGELIFLFCDDIEEQVHRRAHFYRTAPLVKDGILTIGAEAFDRDLLQEQVQLDRRMTDYLLGIDLEASSVVEGSHLYLPTVALDRVILPECEKALIVRTVDDYPRFLEERRRSGLDELVPYGSGLVLFFHGPSGTGKTMLANAIAAHLKKRILLVNYPQIGGMRSDDTLKFLFREARVHDAVLFFDECEGIFQDRTFNPAMRLILTEIERHDGLVILATNRPLELDEAMQRRITVTLRFRAPDAAQREQIWRAHIPSQLRLAGEADFAGLAFRYELTGGLIKNAVVAALALATSRDPARPVVTPDDFEEGARLQLCSRFSTMRHDTSMPTRSLPDIVVPEALRRALNEIVNFEKARRTLVNEWGFDAGLMRGAGTTALFHGRPGTGKTLAAEAIAFELGRPIRRVDASQVVSKWVGEGARNLKELFAEARQSDALLLFDEADGLFMTRTGVSSSTDRYANLDVTILLGEMEQFPGVAILTSNLVDHLDTAFHRRLRFILEFPLPDECRREALWRAHLPDRLPLEPGISIEQLAREFALTGAQIRDAVIKAAARAAQRNGEARLIRHADLVGAARQQLLHGDQPHVVGFRAG